ncbi:MAG: hypothetical protein GKS07_09970 [Nitrosopumilus sp.]|nr:MAG: hypothetical protein GKS07_09970 [Nitrosopumilus sp.]
MRIVFLIEKKKMRTKYLILIVIVMFAIIALYFLPPPFSIIQQMTLSTFKSSTLEEFENMDEVKLLRERYDVTRTMEHFNTFQSQFAEFYLVEPNGMVTPPMMNMVVIKDLITGQINMFGMCIHTSPEGYRIEQRQMIQYLQEYNCFEDKQITQKILDEEIYPFAIMNREHDEIIDQDIVQVVIPSGISDSEKLDLDPAVITVMIGKNNTIRWTNQDDSPSTLYSEEPKWTTGIIKPGRNATIIFNEPGVYEYHGYYHSWKKGTIVVLEE